MPHIGDKLSVKQAGIKYDLLIIKYITSLLPMEEFEKFLNSKNLDEKTTKEILDYLSQNQKEGPNYIEKLIETLPSILEKDGISPIINAINNKNKAQAEIEKAKQIEIKDIELKNLVDARKYLKFKYWQDIAMVSVIMAFIFVLSFTEGLEKQSVGTLIGAIIGYALGRLKGKPSES